MRAELKGKSEMNIAYTMASGAGGTDLLLAGLAEELKSLGWRTCGTVQINTKPCDDHRCDMDVKVLPDGPTIRISQSLGREARGCRLDPSALEQTVVAAKNRLSEGVDILIVNKFGKHEAEGHGFRDLIADALESDVPVIVGLNKQNENAFMEFTQGMATALNPDQATLLSWIEQAARDAKVA